MAATFHLKVATIEGTVTPLEILASPLEQGFMQHMRMHQLGTCRFTHFPQALLAGDCSFQPSNRPTGRFQEQREYFSGKHWNYGIKFESMHLPNGRCVALSSYYPGSVHDKSVFDRRVAGYNQMLAKVPGDQVLDDEPGQIQWAILLDKGYQGAADVCRVIIPIKGQDDELTPQQQQHNRNVAHDRVICENFYGRLKVLWGDGAKIPW